MKNLSIQLFMKNLVFYLILSILIVSPAKAVNVNISDLPSASSVTGTANLFECEQGGTNNQCTSVQIAAYIYGLMNGDATASGTGAITFATVNANVGSFGSATNCVTLTVNAKGLITAASATACTPPFTAITGRATLAQLPQGIANSIWINPTGSTADMTNVAVPACANDGAHALVYVNASGLACASITAGVSSTTGGIGITCSPTTGAVVCSAPATTTNNTGTTDTITSANKGTTVTENNASSIAVAITVAGFVSTDYVTVKDLGAGVATYTPSTGTINGATTLVCKTGQSSDLYFDGTSDIKTLGNTCGQTQTIASGTAALGTSAIGSGACATVVTVGATGVVTTDTVMFGYNGDPTAVTGYGASASGAVLTVYPYPTANNVNVKVCNSSSGSITPGSLTLNFRVVR